MSQSKFKTPAAVTAALVAMLAAGSVTATDYKQAAGSTLVFATKYDGEVFTGTFPGFVTMFSFDPQKLDAGKLDVTIPLASAKSGNADRDSTLQGSDFFNVAKFAQAKYTATKFRSLGNNQYVAEGTLNLRGVSKSVPLTFTWKQGAKPVLDGKATVKRLDFGVGAGDWSDTATIPNEVAISTKVIFEPVK